MRRTSIVLMLVCLLYSHACWGQQPAKFTDSDKVAIEQLLDRYSRAFVTKDYANLAETLQAPFVRLAAGWEAFATLDEAMTFYRKQREALDAQDFAARAQFLDSRMTVLAADRALVNKTFRRYRKDGHFSQRWP